MKAKSTAVFLFVKWVVKDGLLEEVVSLLDEVVRASRKEPGNLVYRIHHHQSEPNTVLLYESYQNEAALAEHRGSEHFKTIVLGEIVPRLASREAMVANEFLFED